MTFDIAYMRRSLDAAFALVMRDERAWTKFDLTSDGFFRSFAAILLVVPVNVLIEFLVSLLAAERRVQQKEPAATRAYEFADAIFATVVLIAEWLIFALVMLALLRFLGLAHRYSALIIAYNWSRVIVALVTLPPLLLYAAGLLSVDQALNLNFIIVGLTLYYRFYIAQSALGAGWGTAAGITLLDFLLQIYLAVAVSFTKHLWLPPSS